MIFKHSVPKEEKVCEELSFLVLFISVFDVVKSGIAAGVINSNTKIFDKIVTNSPERMKVINFIFLLYKNSNFSKVLRVDLLDVVFTPDTRVEKSHLIYF